MENRTFVDLPLSEGMKKTVANMGFIKPTPIQEKSIPDLLLGKDLLGQAQTGTGKTAAFSIPLIELLDENINVVQALVVCPTRELCLQVCAEIKRLSAHKDLESIAIYGGQAIEQQFRSLQINRPHIVVATPGRLFDHLRRKTIELSRVKIIVLDEADEMLDMGFRPEIEQIFSLLPEQNQRIFFSATMPKVINDLVYNYLREPKIVKSESKALTVSTISQSYFRAQGKQKVELLCRVLDMKDPKLAVVFCNAKSIADGIVDELQNRGFEAGVLHGDLSQGQRDRVMAKFKRGLIKVLVATDVAARGLDIDDVELVVNFHLPHDPEDYVHRIGRTGRAGRSGCAVSLVDPRDNTRLRRISQFAKTEIKEENPPTRADVRAAKINNLFSRIKDALKSQEIAEYRTMISKQKMSTEDIAAGMLKISLKNLDEVISNNDDMAFEEIRDKKYSNLPANKRFKERSRKLGPAFDQNKEKRKRKFATEDRRENDRRFPAKSNRTPRPIKEHAPSRTKEKSGRMQNTSQKDTNYQRRENFRPTAAKKRAPKNGF